MFFNKADGGALCLSSELYNENYKEVLFEISNLNNFLFKENFATGKNITFKNLICKYFD